MGEWHGYDGWALGAALRQAGIPEATVAGAAGFLAASGLVVRESYYVPDARELMGLMRRWSYDMRDSSGVRWVICRETFDALARKYTQTRAPAPVSFDSAFWRNDGAELPVAALDMEVMQVLEDRRYWGPDKSMLFGIPIRIDPAARSPLFEVDSEATR